MKLEFVMKTLFALVALLSTAVQAEAKQESFIITPRVGESTLTINNNVLTTNKTIEVDTLAVGVGVGYVAPFGLLVEGSTVSQGNWDVFGLLDRYDLTEYSAALGYRFETPHGFVITPKVGRSRWTLHTKDPHWINPDSDNEHSISGLDNFWEFNLQKKVGRRAAMGISFKDNHYQFGNVRSTAFIVSIAL
jgi:hypothetical protein